MEIGKAIKQLRIQNNLTLEELASRCELTKGFLSQVERDLTSPSISTLNDILEALGTSLANFFKEEKNEKSVFTEDDFFVDQREESTVHWIVPNAQKNQMEPIIVDIPPMGESMEQEPHDGEEFGYILAGKIVIAFEDRELVVKKGETFYLRGGKAHKLLNRTNKQAKVLWVCTPPLF
ncbi:MAG: helix-turn-helix domain-containing protein [Erysipelotrichaceae bacterium]